MRRNFVHTSAASINIGAAIPRPSTPAPATHSAKTLPASPTAVAETADTFALPVESTVESNLNVEGKAFDAAVKRGGGHFVTVKPSTDTYMPVYYSHGKSYAGKVHHVKEKGHRKHVGEEAPSDSVSSDSSDTE